MTLESAITVRTPEQVLADTADEIADRGGNDKSFPETSTPRQVLISHSEALSAEESIRADLVRAGSLSLIPQIAESNGRDAWLRDYAAPGTFNLTADPATKALHVFKFANDPLGIQRTFAPGQLRARFGNLDFINVTYADITEFGGSGTVAPGETLNLLMECQTPGTTGNIPPNYVTQLVTVFAGVSVSNPPIDGQSDSIYRAARDIERNESLTDRCYSRWGASSAGGCVGSIVEWIHEAFVVAGIANPITKWYIDDTNPDGPGTTRAYLATDAGPAPSEPIATVQSYLDTRRTAGSGLSDDNPTGILVLPAIQKPVSFNATIKNSSNTNAVADYAAVITALNAESPLGYLILYRTEMIKRLKLVEGTIDIPALTFENTTLAPGENLVLTATIEVIP